MTNTATTFLALLRDDDFNMKSLALKKLELLVNTYWAEISDYLKDFENLYVNDLFNEQKPSIALIISNLYFHLEEYELAIEWALNANTKFNINDNSQFTKTILNKIIDKYIGLRKNMFYLNLKRNEDDEQVEEVKIDERITNLIVRIFQNCIENKNFKQAIGMCVDSYDLGRLSFAIERSSDIPIYLEHVFEISQEVIQNKVYKNALVTLILDLYLKFADKEYEKIIECQFLLRNIEGITKTMIRILESDTDPCVAYQIAFNFYDNQNNHLLHEISTKLEILAANTKVKKEDLEKIKLIFEGKIQKKIISTALVHLNKSNKKLLEELLKGVEKCGSPPALAAIISHSLMHARTFEDTQIKSDTSKGIISKMTNWCRFTATASLGIIHQGNIEKGLEIMDPFLPGSRTNPSVYAQSGAYYGLGLIYANSREKMIVDKLNEALAASENKPDCLTHGVLLATGLVNLGVGKEFNYTKIREFMYKDNAIVGEAATYAIGLIMIGTKNANVIEDLFVYAHETQHEKIIRAIAVSLGLIMYGAEEEADELIDKMLIEKDPILRYGAMYVIGMAYAGTSNSLAFKKLIKYSCSDVNDDVRRAALINVGFVHFKNPKLLIEKISILKLLSESFNPHVRYGTVLGLGIAFSGTQNSEAYKIIHPLLEDSSPLVRQGSYIAGSMVFSQMNVKNDTNFDSFKESLNKVNATKDEHNLIKYGALLGQGILELGGKNCLLTLLSHTNNNRLGAIAGIALFTQYYYWYPMTLFISLAIRPQIFMGIDDTFRLVKNYCFISKSKPSVYGYPKEIVQEDKKKETNTQAAVLSSQTRILAKKKSRLGLNSSNITDINIQLDKNLSSIPDDKLTKKQTGNPGMIVEVNENPDDKNEKKEEVKEEPLEELLENPCRIMPLQNSVIEIIPDQMFEQILNNKYSGIHVLKRIRNEPVEYLENKKDTLPPINEPNKSNTNKEVKENKPKDEYKSVPTNDDPDLPEEFDADMLNNNK